MESRAVIVDPDFPDHWKTRTLVGLLGDDEAAPVYVIRLWAHCQNRRQWRFNNLSPEALKALCRFPGHANKLETSLAASGFVRREADELIVCGWDGYNASLVAAWSNGAKGGRPPKPTGSGRKTRGKPTGIPTGSREEKKGEEKKEDKDIAAAPPVVAIRERDLIWDAIVEVTGADASIPSVASHIGKVKKALQGAKPAYSPEEVRALPGVAARDLPWTAGRPLTLGEIEKNISLVRLSGARVGKARQSPADEAAAKLVEALNRPRTT